MKHLEETKSNNISTITPLCDYRVIGISGALDNRTDLSNLLAYTNRLMGTNIFTDLMSPIKVVGMAAYGTGLDLGALSIAGHIDEASAYQVLEHYLKYLKSIHNFPNYSLSMFKDLLNGKEKQYDLYIPRFSGTTWSEFLDHINTNDITVSHHQSHIINALLEFNEYFKIDGRKIFASGSLQMERLKLFFDKNPI
eukprot:NODE_1027_length_2547_cov_0.477941.p1 type:complete len:195 gc:universal NODE_1027_length_2547_cov_0.477941:543-1127(+)